MNELVVSDFSKDELQLIKDTVAKNATDQELKLFLYRCKNLRLNPLNPGEIHFVKYGSNPGTIVLGLDGMRKRASKSGKHIGTKRGVHLDKDGNLIGAWAEVYRSDWAHPAREDVDLSEYDTGRAQWAKMKATMIKKVAEAAALRMAFPDDLGGIYSQEEIDQASAVQESKARSLQASLSAPRDVEVIEPSVAQAFDVPEAPAASQTPSKAELGVYVIPIGKDIKGKRLCEVDREKIAGLLAWAYKQERLSPSTQEFVAMAETYLEQTQ